MSIDLSSRYAQGHYTSSYPNPRLEQKYKHSTLSPSTVMSIPVVIRGAHPGHLVDTVYVWREGDRWDTVAFLMGIPKTEWWKILDANPHIEFPTSVRPGDVLNVPIVSKKVL